jgi:membrane-bound ClpP family serine protease
MEIAIVLVLLLAGITFLLIELFLIPGLSLAGIASLLLTGSSVYYAYAKIGSTAGHLTLLGGVVLSGVAVWIFLKSKTLEKMSLKAKIDGKNDPLANVKVNIGDTGTTISRLAPMGKVKVNGFVIEAKTNDDFVDEGSQIRVIEVLNTNVLVERM